MLKCNVLTRRADTSYYEHKRLPRHDEAKDYGDGADAIVEQANMHSINYFKAR